MLKRVLLVVFVFVLFIVLIIPARAAGEPWVLWSSFDCTEWSQGCDSGMILVPETSYTTVTLPESIQCDDARVRVGLGPPMCSEALERFAFDVNGYAYIFEHPYAEFRLMNYQSDVITLSDNWECDGYVSGVVIECYDPRPESFYGVPGEIEPGELETMSDAGMDILSSSAATILPMIIGLAVGMGIVVTILRMVRWL